MKLRLLVEGALDEAVARRLGMECGLEVEEQAYGKNGWTVVRSNVVRFNDASPPAPFLAMVDFMDVVREDKSLECPAAVVQTWTPERHPNMLLRVVVREIESWLLADRQGMAEFLFIPIREIPLAPEDEEDPKRALINLARRSRNREVREGLVPQLGSTAKEGRWYNAEMERFIRSKWSPAAARTAAPSLDKCMTRLAELAGRLG